EAKRTRILDVFFEGVITKTERDKRLKAVDDELARLGDMTAKAIAPPMAVCTTDQLAALLHVFAEFRFLNRDEKRSILAASRTRVFMDVYTIDRLEMVPPFNCSTPLSSSYTDSHFPAAAASLPARCAETPAARLETARRCAPEKPRPAGERFH